MPLSDTPFKVVVNGQTPIEVLSEDAYSMDMIATGDRKGHIIRDHKSYTYEVVSTNYAEKIFVIRINGSLYNVKINDKYDRLISHMGLSSQVIHQVKDIKAPMPGLVLDMFVKPGEKVSTGDKILILEAMKMENVIKSPGDGVIKAVHVRKGDSLEKGHLMIEME